MMLEELEKGGETQMSLSDPDSRAMAACRCRLRRPARGRREAYKLIVAQEVTNQVVDMGC